MMNAGSPTRITWALGLGAILALASCSEKEIILPGERLDLRAADGDAAATAAELIPENQTVAFRAGAQSNNTSWTQRPGSPSTRTNHPAFGGAMQLLWSANIGAGDSRRQRITADPVVADGRVFTLDSSAQVTATSTSGATLWTKDLVPERDRSGDASGGGLAYGSGMVFVSSGFGLMTALDAKTGGEVWQQKLDATGSGSPTVYGDLVYLVAGDNLAWALDRDTGRIRWQLSATPDVTNVMGGPAPAVNDQMAIFAFGSGELQAAFRRGGLRLWDATISGHRKGFARARISDITGDPVISGTTVYAGSHSGRMVALDMASGTRLWTAEEGPLNPVWVGGGSVFLISDRNELVRLDASDGSRIWGSKLPFFVKDRPKQQKEIFAHYGPVVAGNSVIVASNDGLIRSFDPASGALRNTGEIPGGATTNPVFAGGVMYVVSTKGQLHAFR